MSRPLASWPALGAALHRLVAADPPGWLSPETAYAARALLDHLRADVLRATAGAVRRGPEGAPARVGAGDGSWVRWVARGGWLAPRAGEP